MFLTYILIGSFITLVYRVFISKLNMIILGKSHGFSNDQTKRLIDGDTSGGFFGNLFVQQIWSILMWPLIAAAMVGFFYAYMKNPYQIKSAVKEYESWEVSENEKTST